MTMRERRVDRGRRLARRSLITIGDELREARLSAGLTQQELGDLAGRSHSEVSRIERGLVAGVPYETLSVMGAVLGLDVPLRAYPNGDRVRDAAQLRLLAKLRAILPGSLRHRTEVPLPIPGDPRAWDEVIDGPSWSLPVEAESRVRDTQALRRRLALKVRDAAVDRMLLVISDTRHNRAAMRLAAPDFAEAFPIRSSSALRALQRGEPPPGSAIVFL